MKFLCKCGKTIHDTTDDLFYKGTIIADQDMAALWDIIEKLEKPHEKKIDVYNEFSNIINRNIYQCPTCGRVYIEDQSDNYNFVQYNAENEEQKNINKRLLISAYGEKWKGYLYGEWRDEKPERSDYHGYIDPTVNIQLDNLVFNDFEAFKKRFFEVFEYLKSMDIINYATLKINREEIFHWPER
ncbi:hypothetical protein [uncultured Eubacterium sp.]|uniref:hypothetical protein n=1 Tax=uncultured Eubacterium sp. TaxID=165185 RepID=UPI0025942214|nr:hypothetical protein [uncultured Eubacterium sp.]